MMNSLTDEIAELCRLIVSFENRVAAFREKMFNNSSITEDHLWGYITGGDTETLGSLEIYNFLHKHKRPVKMAECKLLFHRCSSKRDGLVTKNDLWTIFHPKTIKQADSIIKTRKIRNPLSKSS